MRTSGSSRDGLMATIPISVILIYVMIAAGGPKEFLKATEKRLRSTVEWTVQLVR